MLVCLAFVSTAAHTVYHCLLCVDRWPRMVRTNTGVHAHSVFVWRSRSSAVWCLIALIRTVLADDVMWLWVLRVVSITDGRDATKSA